LKMLGVTHLISVGAVGSLREEIEPGHMVFPDQFIDLTRHRKSTFFGNGVVGHVQFGNPVCSELSGKLVEAAQTVGATMHVGGTYICMEGPAFSSRAESLLYRSWGADVIGMTNVQEAKLAREADGTGSGNGLCLDRPSHRLRLLARIRIRSQRRRHNQGDACQCRNCPTDTC